MLSAQTISINFGAVRALDEVSVTVAAGEIAGLIGPNGSGKTTLFNCICGYYHPSTGRILMLEHDLTRLPPQQRARSGIGRTFQLPNLFSDLSVFENISLAAESMALKGSVLRGLRLRCGSVSRDWLMSLLESVGLASYAHARPHELPVGLAKLADLARALALSPKVLLLDEPAAGLNDGERHQLAELLKRLNQRDGLSMLVVEHNMAFVMSLCTRLTVLASGKTISAGPSEEVRKDPNVIQAYLGEEQYAEA